MLLHKKYVSPTPSFPLALYFQFRFSVKSSLITLLTILTTSLTLRYISQLHSPLCCCYYASFHYSLIFFTAYFLHCHVSTVRTEVSFLSVLHREGLFQLLNKYFFNCCKGYNYSNRWPPAEKLKQFCHEKFYIYVKMVIESGFIYNLFLFYR